MTTVEELVKPELAPQIAGLDDVLILRTGVIQPATPAPVAPELDETSPISLMEQLLNEANSTLRSFEYGQVLDGIVMYKDRDELLVDVGTKSEGIITSRELQSLTPEEWGAIKVGDNLLVFVMQAENEEGQPVLSLDRARLEKVWRKLQEQSEVGTIVEGEVFGTNKGGLLVSVEGVRGFVPTSQVSGLGNNNNADLNRFVNTKMMVKLLEVDRSRNRLIMSERQASQEQRDVQKERLMSELAEGQIRDGVVRTICDFGAFVDIGGADGLVHLSELSWNRVGHPSELLKPGDSIKVFVLNIDENRKKVALSLKRTQPEPWAQIATAYQPGQLLEGIITQVTNFGAFTRIADGVEGLIHVSELAEGRVNHPNDVVKSGDRVTVRLLTIDPQRRRLSLSLKRAANGYNEAEVEEKEVAGTVV